MLCASICVENLRHAVDIGLAADEAGLRKRERFGDQMFAAAESDLRRRISFDQHTDSEAGSAASAPAISRRDAAADVRSGRPDDREACVLAPSEKRTVTGGLVRERVFIIRHVESSV